MKYSEKVKKSNSVIKAIKALKNEERLKVTYGKGFKGEPNIYTIHAYKSEIGGPGEYKQMSYSIWNSLSGMNIEKIGRTTMKTYTFDMMSQRSSYTFPLYEMSVVVEIEDPLKQLKGYMGTEKGTLTK